MDQINFSGGIGGTSLNGPRNKIRKPRPKRSPRPRRGRGREGSPSTIATFDAIQTFFVDPAAVGQATSISLTSVSLYFKLKPVGDRNTSGAKAAGAIVSICQVINGSPDPTKILANSVVRVPYENIYPMSDASVATIFAFETPVIVTTNAFYGIVVSYEDSAFDLWTNKQGDAIIGTNTPSSGTTNTKDGKYYVKTNSGSFNAINNTELKFTVNAAKYSANSITLDFVNKDYEFLTLSNTSGSFTGGELVFQYAANATGNIACSTGNTAIIGTNTTFTSIIEGGYITVWNGSNTEVLQTAGIANDTYLTVVEPPSFTNAAAKFMITAVGKVYYQDGVQKKLYLVDSSANSTLKFAAAGIIQGDLSNANGTIASLDSYAVDQFVPEFTIDTTDAATVSVDYVISAANVVDTSLLASAVNDEVNYCDKYKGQILSRSTEVGLATLYDTTEKSALVRLQINVATTSNTFYSAPTLTVSEADFFVYQNKINNTYLNGNIDTEVYKNGLALSKGFTMKTAFANNRFAEDLRVYMTAYRPVGTDLRVYAKIHKSTDTETFDDKLWTPLQVVQNANVYSSSTDKDDLVEYEYGLPQFPDTNFTVNGTFTTTLSNNVVVANGFDPSANLTANTLVKIYNPLFANSNYEVAFVTAANSTTVTLSSPIANNNVVGSGFAIDTLLYNGTAFRNYENGNVVRYFTLAMTPIDRFDSMQFKIVFLAANTNLVPEVDDFQAIGINAGT